MISFDTLYLKWYKLMPILVGLYCLAEVNYGSCEADFGRAEVNNGKAEADYGRAEANYGRAEANYGRAEADYGRVEMNYGSADGKDVIKYASYCMMQ